jgi:hypothetical protein
VENIKKHKVTSELPITLLLLTPDTKYIGILTFTKGKAMSGCKGEEIEPGPIRAGHRVKDRGVSPASPPPVCIEWKWECGGCEVSPERGRTREKLATKAST